MQVRKLSCREHGGTFSIPMKAGRPPTKCGGKYPACSNAQTVTELRAVQSRSVSAPAVKPNIRAKVGKRQAELVNTPVSRVERAASRIKNRRVGNTQVLETPARRPKAEPLPRTLPAAKARRKAAEEASEVVETVNHVIPLAHQAKTTLEPLGWTVTGRRWSDEDAGTDNAEITATRGSELLVIQWIADEAGVIDTQQQYSLWNIDAPLAAQAAKPRVPNKLKFDPDEMSDGELIRTMAGQKITWWNILGKSVETAVVSSTKIQVDHTFDADGHELPGDRILKFVDHDGGGFRAFRVAALLSVG